MAENKVTSMYPAPMVDVPRPSTIEELVATVAFYGMAEIPADLLATLEDIAADLAEDDGTRRGERHPPTDPCASQADASPAPPGAWGVVNWLRRPVRTTHPDEKPWGVMTLDRDADSSPHSRPVIGA